eukprot:1977575-Amphidinium_carterae.1
MLGILLGEQMLIIPNENHQKVEGQCATGGAGAAGASSGRRKKGPSGGYGQPGYDPYPDTRLRL